MSSPPIVDLRSDTVTRPTPEMRAFMAAAPVGDDVIDKDPTIEALQNLTAELLGKEAAIYMPSGTMTNQIAVRIHCKPGDEFLCETECHIYHYEQGAYAQLSGVATKTIPGIDGILSVEQFDGTIRPDNEHSVRTRLVCLENTHNRASGRVQPYENVAAICRWAQENGLRRHLDGARLFNAVAATGIDARTWSQHFDTVSVCFSKGLGAPVGSCLAGPREMIKEARRHRKLFGGAMRQAGIIAAGALFGLQHHRERLGEDHRNAKLLEQAVRDSEGLALAVSSIDTNIVICNVDPKLGTAAQLAGALAEQGVLAIAISKQRVRFVTHLDVSRADCARAADAVVGTMKRMRAGELRDKTSATY